MGDDTPTSQGIDPRSASASTLVRDWLATPTVIMDRGGCWDFAHWELQFDVPVLGDAARLALLCEHAGPVQTRRGLGPRYESYRTVPRVVVAMNEGGHGSTGVCLECILAAATITKPTPGGEA